MRTLNECQAEVFRRGEKRIKERRQRRNRFLMTCIPLMLCLVVLLTFALPELIPARTKAPGPNELSMGLLSEEQPESAAVSIVKVEVTGYNRTVTHTAAEDVQKICQYLEHCKLTPPQSGGAGTEKHSGNKSNSLTPPVYGMDNADYTITVITEAGLKTQYCLIGTVLQDLTAHQEYTLTQTQAEKLRSLLGLQ